MPNLVIALGAWHKSWAMAGKGQGSPLLLPSLPQLGGPVATALLSLPMVIGH